MKTHDANLIKSAGADEGDDNSDLIKSLDGLREDVTKRTAAAEKAAKDAADKSESLVKSLETSVGERFDEIEKTVADSLVKSAPVDGKDQIRKALLAAFNGDDSLIKSLPEGFLAEGKVREILPEQSVDGFDLLEVAHVKSERAANTSVGLPALDGLKKGTETPSDFAAIARTYTLGLGFQYLGYSKQEFSLSNLTAADENAKAFVQNRQASLARWFAKGDHVDDGSDFKGMDDYDITQTDEANKLRVVEATDGTAANVRQAIIAARNKLKVGKHIVAMNGNTITLLETLTKANGESYFVWRNGKRYFEDCEVWKNAEMPDVAADGATVCAVVFNANRGYGVGLNPELIVSSKAEGSKTYLYIGQGCGGGILDFEAIQGVIVPTP